MIRVWALSLAVLCALQCFGVVSGEPRPDFALHRPLYGTPKVFFSLSELGFEAGSLSDDLSLELETDYHGLSSVLAAVSSFASGLDSQLGSVLGPLGSLAGADSASAFVLFGQTQSAIDSTLSFLYAGYEALFDDLKLVRQPLPSQFEDALERVAHGLQELRDALDALGDYVDGVLSQSSEESACRRRDVPPRLVYRVAYALRNLRAYLPLVAYLLRTTVENVRLADEFVMRLETETSTVQNAEQYVAVLNAGLFPIVTSVSSAVTGVGQQLSSVLAAVSGLSHLSTVSSYPQLQSALQSFQTVLGQLSSASAAFYAALETIGDELEELLNDPVTNVPTVDNAAVVRTLVRTLLSNGPFARYCFCKYSELLFSFADLGMNGVEQCIDRELLRMRHHERTMLQRVEQLVYDFQDIVEQLTSCDRIQRPNQRYRCVRQLAIRYAALAANFDVKFDDLFQDGITEANASRERLAACVIALQFRLIDESNDDLKRDIRKCARYGPYCPNSGSSEASEED